MPSRHAADAATIGTPAGVKGVSVSAIAAPRSAAARGSRSRTWGAINFVAFWRYLAPASMEPQVFVIIGATIAAAEAAVGLAVILNVYRRFNTIEVGDIDRMKG